MPPTHIRKVPPAAAADPHYLTSNGMKVRDRVERIREHIRIWLR
jgi:hypothetical protein